MNLFAHFSLSFYQQEMRCLLQCCNAASIFKYKTDVINFSTCYKFNFQFIIIFIGPPPKVDTDNRISGTVKQEVILKCNVNSDIPYNISWSRLVESIGNGGKFCYTHTCIQNLNYIFIYLLNMIITHCIIESSRVCRKLIRHEVFHLFIIFESLSSQCLFEQSQQIVVTWS